MGDHKFLAGWRNTKDKATKAAARKTRVASSTPPIHASTHPRIYASTHAAISAALVENTITYMPTTQRKTRAQTTYSRGTVGHSLSPPRQLLRHAGHPCILCMMQTTTSTRCTQQKEKCVKLRSHSNVRRTTTYDVRHHDRRAAPLYARPRQTQSATANEASKERRNEGTKE